MGAIIPPKAPMRRITRVPPQHLIAVALAVLVLGVYWQVGGHAFVVMDDGEYVFQNPVVARGLTLDGISWALTTFHFSNWHPLTWLSHMTDVSLFGLDAGWHHRVNLLFHLLNTELLFLVLWRMTGGMWQSAFVAALFGVHPLHVESVAWVSERKDVLSTLFWILTMGAYLRYVRRPGAGRYVPVAASLALGLMCKPMLVTLPFVLLLLDWWPLGRLAPADAPHVPPWRVSVPVLARLAREKIPLFVLSAAACAATYLAQQKGGAVTSVELYPPGLRLANATVSYVTYLRKLVWPSSLSVFYPHPAALPPWEVWGSAALLLAVTAAAAWQRRRRPYLAVGWLWYAGTLVPVIGLVQVGAQASADRYTYVPLIGIFLAVAWGVPPALSGLRLRRVLSGALAAVSLTALSTAAWVQAGHWRDSVTLFSRAEAVTEGNWLALNNLGAAYQMLGQHHRAVACSKEAVRIKPDYALAWTTLGLAYENLGQLPEAVASSREAVRIKPDFALAWNNLGVAYAKLGELRQAVACFQEAVRIKPDFTLARNNLGLACARLGEIPSDKKRGYRQGPAAP